MASEHDAVQDDNQNGGLVLPCFSSRRGKEHEIWQSKRAPGIGHSTITLNHMWQMDK